MPYTHRYGRSYVRSVRRRDSDARDLGSRRAYDTSSDTSGCRLAAPERIPDVIVAVVFVADERRRRSTAAGSRAAMRVLAALLLLRMRKSSNRDIITLTDRLKHSDNARRCGITTRD